MPLLPSSGQLNSMCSLKSSNLRVVFTFAPLDSLSSSPSFATQWLASAGSVGSHPVRSLPLKIGSAAVHAFGELRLSTGARTPARPANTLAPRFSTPVRLPPLGFVEQLAIFRHPVIGQCRVGVSPSGQVLAVEDRLGGGPRLRGIALEHGRAQFPEG